MKILNVPCRQIRYREFPDLLFGRSQDDGSVYFDATHFMCSRGCEQHHGIREFRVAFQHWISALSEFYAIDAEDLIVYDQASGHLLIDDCLSLLFIVYIDPLFGVYMLERMSEMLTEGFTISDTWLINAVSLRFTKEELTQISEHHET